jgi:hypothetical protein
MTKDEALKLALEALNDLAAWNDGEVGGHMDEPYAAEVARRTITAIKEALAQPEQRTWVHLTNEEHTELAIEWGCLSADWVFYAAAVERKVKEKNT